MLILALRLNECGGRLLAVSAILFTCFVSSMPASNAEESDSQIQHALDGRAPEKSEPAEERDGDTQHELLYELMLRHAIPPSYVDISDVRLLCETADGSMAQPAPDTIKGPCILKGTIKNNHHRFEIYKIILDVVLSDCVKETCATLITLPIRIDRIIQIKNSTYVEGPFLIPAEVRPKGSLKIEYSLNANWAYLDQATRDAEVKEAEEEEKSNS